jgi:hypothetical protein
MDVAVVNPNGRIYNVIVVASVEEAQPPYTLAEVSISGDWRKLSYSAISGVHPTPPPPILRSSLVRTGADLYVGIST